MPTAPNAIPHLSGGSAIVSYISTFKTKTIYDHFKIIILLWRLTVWELSYTVLIAEEA